MSSIAPPVPDAYDRLAPYYEEFTHDYGHDDWLEQLERLARSHGLHGSNVLDVACGTGKSLRPLLALGYAGEGCDISGSMLDEARERMPDVTLFEADMRSLPRRGPYAWVTCINDAVNHLMEDGDLRRTFTAMARVLAPDGLVTFDVNTRATHQSVYQGTFVVRRPATVVCWRGLGCAAGEAVVGTADVTILSETERGWRRTVSRQCQRWWSDVAIEAAAEQAGLRVVGRHGQRPGAIVEDYFDDRRHAKVVYFLSHDRRRAGLQPTM